MADNIAERSFDRSVANLRVSKSDAHGSKVTLRAPSIQISFLQRLWIGGHHDNWDDRRQR
jgi:hypothetical protein